MNVENSLVEEVISVLTNKDACQKDRMSLAIRLKRLLSQENDVIMKFSKNLSLRDIDVYDSHWVDGETEEDEVEHVTMLELSFGFYGSYGTAYIKPERLQDERSGSFATIETSSDDDILDSFCDALEDEYWAGIREECIKFLKDNNYSSDCEI